MENGMETWKGQTGGKGVWVYIAGMEDEVKKSDVNPISGS